MARFQVAKIRELVAIVYNIPCPNPGEALSLRGGASTQGWVSNSPPDMLVSLSGSTLTISNST